MIKLARVSLYREEQTGDDLKFKDGDTPSVLSVADQAGRHVL